MGRVEGSKRRRRKGRKKQEEQEKEKGHRSITHSPKGLGSLNLKVRLGKGADILIFLTF